MRRKTASSARTATERSLQAASEARLGAWERSLRVNGYVDKEHLIVGAMLVIVPWIPIIVGLFLFRDWSWGNGVFIGMGVLFLCIGLFFFGTHVEDGGRVKHGFTCLPTARCWSARKGGSLYYPMPRLRRTM